MKGNEIVSAVDQFIENRMYHYALMIKGEWGIGKTYFINNELKEHIQNKEYILSNNDKNAVKLDVIYVSLYGINDISTLGNTLLFLELKNKAEKTTRIDLDQKLVKGVWKTGGIIARTALATKFDIKIDDYKELLELIPNYDDNVVIFDDLERCGCDINETLGFINEFVEHSNAAVIIVANETEIGKCQLDNNKELQVLVASEKGIHIEIPKESENKIWKDASLNDKKQHDGFSLEEIEHRKQVLFSKNEQYKRIKEKVIGQTINYDPDIKEVYRSLLNKNGLEEGFKRLCISLLDDFVKNSEKEKCRNIRAYLFFLEKGNQLFRVTKNKYELINNAVYTYLFIECLRFSKGEKLQEWEGEYGIISLHGQFSDAVWGFRFVDQFVEHNLLNEIQMMNTLDTFLKKIEEEGKLIGDPYQVLQNWWLLEDVEIENNFKQLSKNITAGKYTTTLFPEIIKLISYLRINGLFKSETNQIVNDMKEYALKAEEKDLCHLRKEQLFITNNEQYQEAINILNELGGILDERIYKSIKNQYTQMLNKENWAEEIEQDILDHKYQSRKSFVYWIEPESLVKKLKKSPNRQLDTIRRAFRSIYRDTIPSQQTWDLDHLRTIKILLEEEPWEGQIQSWHIQILKDNIEEYIKQIEGYEVS